jgi:hypothetical protein
MRIDPLGTPPPLKPNTAGNAARTTSRSSEGTSSATDAGSFTPTSELAALLSAVRQAPDVRTDAVESATAKLASGELDTPEAAADTAKAFLATAPENPNA